MQVVPLIPTLQDATAMKRPAAAMKRPAAASGSGDAPAAKRTAFAGPAQSPDGFRWASTYLGRLTQKYSAAYVAKTMNDHWVVDELFAGVGSASHCATMIHTAVQAQLPGIGHWHTSVSIEPSGQHCASSPSGITNCWTSGIDWQIVCHTRFENRIQKSNVFR
jgi:hypothetical protein